MEGIKISQKQLFRKLYSKIYKTLCVQKLNIIYIWVYIQVSGCWLESLYFGKFLPLKFFKIYWSEDFTNPLLLLNSHCVKSVQIRSNFSSVFSPNSGKYGPEITPYMDTFHAVSLEQKNSTFTFQALIWNEGLRYRWRENSHFRYGSLFSNSPRGYHGDVFTIVGL